MFPLPPKRKRAPVTDEGDCEEERATPTVVTPQKKQRRAPAKEEESYEQEDESGGDERNTSITGDTMMGFTKFPTSTNREIMINDYGFVKWAKKQREVAGSLAAFLEWAESDEGRSLEFEGAGNETMSYGQHKGETFAEIARNDPGYHDRFMYMLNMKRQEPDPKLARYIDWFDQRANNTAAVAARTNKAAASSVSGGERFAFGQHKGATFQKVCKEDPSYLLRFKSKIPALPPVMERYAKYFAVHGDVHAVQQGENDALAYHAGIAVDCGYYDEY